MWQCHTVPPGTVTGRWTGEHQTGGSMRRLLALQQFRRSEGEVTKLLLVDGRDQRVIDGREGGLFLSKIRVEVVDVLWGFLEGNNEEWFISSNILAKSTPANKVIHVTYDPGLERWLHFPTIQLLPINVREEGVAGHGALSTLRGHAAQTPGRVFGQELWKPQDKWIHINLNHCKSSRKWM